MYKSSTKNTPREKIPGPHSPLMEKDFIPQICNYGSWFKKNNIKILESQLL